MESKENIKGFDEFISNTTIELMPNSGIDYDKQLDDEINAVKDYFQSELFSIIKKTIR